MATTIRGLTTSDKFVVNPGTPNERRVLVPFAGTGTAMNFSTFHANQATIATAYIVKGIINDACISTLECSNVHIVELSATNTTCETLNVSCQFAITSIRKPAAKNSTCSQAGIITFDVGTSALYLSVATNKWVRVALASWS